VVQLVAVYCPAIDIVRWHLLAAGPVAFGAQPAVRTDAHRIVLASLVPETDVHCAHVVVVAVEVPGTGTSPVHTGITCRTRIPVGAIVVVERVQASLQQITRIVGAQVAVVAIQVAAALTRALLAHISRRARIAVAARIGVVCVRTSKGRVTSIIGADIPVVAVERGAALALPVQTVVPGSAGIAVVAQSAVGTVLAADFRIARIVRTWIAIPAIRDVHEYALSAHTMVTDGARILVVALSLVVVMDAPDLGIARVISADVAVVAVESRSRIAGSIPTQIPGRADIAVVARILVVGVDATFPRIAEIVGAWIAVVAVDRSFAGATPLLAALPNRAFVAVVADLALVGRLKRALAGHRVARSGQAFGTEPVGLAALDHGSRVHRTRLRKRIQIAEQRTVADIPVLQLSAIRVSHAFARHCEAQALTQRAGIVHRTRILVVAGGAVEFRQAACSGQAVIVGAAVSVVADDLRPYAHALITVIGLGAHVCVAAFGTGENLAHAADVRIATVGSTLVIVVARDVVDLPVTVVVEAIAHLLKGHTRVTVGKAGLFANSQAGTFAPLIFNVAGCSQRQLDRRNRAIANS